MIIRPIPKTLMPSQIQYLQFSGSGRYGDTFSDPISVVNVRVVPKSQLRIASTYYETIDFNSMLYIDAHTSKQLDTNGSKLSLTIKPKEKDEVVFNGVTYIIVNSTECLADNGKLHHYECILNRK